MAAILLSHFAVVAAAQAPAVKSKPAIELGAHFADNAILQRHMPVPVWGWSKPGMKVMVEFAGENKHAIEGEDAKWMLKLDALQANAALKDHIQAKQELDAKQIEA
jgi:sialate O-acetylesterase